MSLFAGSLLATQAEGQIFRRGNQGYNQNYQPPVYQQPMNQAPQQGQYQGQYQGQPIQGQVVQGGTNPSQGAVLQGNQASGFPATQASQPQKHWSQMLLEDREHDFGAVAKMSTQEYIFQFPNPLDGELFIDSAEASCRCTRPTVLTSVVKPGEMAQIKAAFDTRGFEGHKSATVRVRVRRSQPYHESAELLLNVKGMIRRDVVMEPGEFGFGQMKSGSTATRTMVVKYAGNPQWQILDVKPSNDKFKVNIQETMRDPSRMRVDYTITVEANPELPKGDINEQVILVTNDPNLPQLSVPVSGRIKVGIEASDIRLGTLEPGKPVERKLLVKGDSAFAVVGVQSDSPAIQFANTDNVYRTVHMLTYRVDTSKQGPISGSIRLQTTDPDQPEIMLSAAAEVMQSTLVKGGNEVAGDKE